MGAMMLRLPLQQKVNRMSQLEQEAIKEFCRRNVIDIDPAPFAFVLRENCIIDQQFFQTILKKQKQGVPRTSICWSLILETIKNCCLEELLTTLYYNNYKTIAQQLCCCYLECKNRKAISRVYRAGTHDRRKLGEYFKSIKQNVHDLVFNNAFSHVQNICERFKDKIAKETDPEKRMRYCDIFVAFKAAGMDALTNIQGIVKVDDPGYLDIERYVSSTTNERLSRVMLYGRQADVVSTVGNFKLAEDFIKGALVDAEMTEECVEVTDMIYKNVVVKLSKFEKHPYDEQLRKSIIYEADKGLWTLKSMTEDLRLFWTKLFLLRMIFAHLGIGKFCDMISNYSPSNESLLEAERLLKLDTLKDLEHRRQMFIAVARARLNEWKGYKDAAIQCLKIAKNLAQEGRYAENRALKDYERHLTRYTRGIYNNQDHTVTSSHLLLTQTIESNISATDSIPKLSMHMSTFEDSYDREDETDIKHVLSTAHAETIFSSQRVTPGSELDHTHSAESESACPSEIQHALLVPGFSLSSVPTLDISSLSSSLSNESFEHLDPNSIQANTIVAPTNTPQSESFPSLEHLHISSFEDTQ